MSGLNIQECFRVAKRAMIYERATRKPLGYIRAMTDAKLEDKKTWDVWKTNGELHDQAIKDQDYSLAFTATNYESKLLVLFSNGKLTQLTDAPAEGEIYNSENVQGDSVLSAITGCTVGLTA